VTSAHRVETLAMTALSLLLMAVLVVGFSVNGYRPLVAALAGVWWGLMPLVLFDGGVSAVAPAWIIRWRQEAMQRPGSRVPMQAETARWLSEQFATDGPEPWNSAIARRRVRLFGMVELFVWLAVGVVLVLVRG